MFLKEMLEKDESSLEILTRNYDILDDIISICKEDEKKVKVLIDSLNQKLIIILILFL